MQAGNMTPTVLQPPTSVLSFFFLCQFLFFFGNLEAHWTAADAPTFNATSAFPECTVKEPGGKWSVAITNGTAPVIFGKARETNEGTIDVYFPFVKFLNHVEMEQPFRIMLCGELEKNASDTNFSKASKSNSRKYQWVDLQQVQRGLVDREVVQLGGWSPFSILDDRGEWQLGRIDAGLTRAWYVHGEGVEAVVVYATGPWLRRGRVLCAVKSEFAESDLEPHSHEIDWENRQMAAAAAESFVHASRGISASGRPKSSSVVTYALLAGMIFNGIALAVVLIAYCKINAVNKIGKRTYKSSSATNPTTRPTPINRSHHSIPTSSVSITVDIEQGERPQSINMDFTLNVEKTGRRIGNGNFGIIEEGILTDIETGRSLVALKFQTRDQQDQGDIIKELEVFQKVPPHRNIVKCFGGGKIGQTRCLVEELMVRSLHDVVHGDQFSNRATYRMALAFFTDIVQGLEHLHRWGIVHCDLKPQNLLVDASNTVKIADFGISRKKVNSYITARLQGTLPYIAPEVLLAGFMPAVPVRANYIDVFSFGVIMWETVTGRVPNSPPDPKGSRKLNRAGLMKNTDDFKKKFPLNSFCPPELRDLIWDAIKFYAEERPSCKEIRERLAKMNDAVWLDQRIRLQQ